MSRLNSLLKMIFSNDTSVFINIQAYIKHVTPGRGHFWPKGHNLNKLGRGPRGDLHTKYQGSGPYGFRQEDFPCFSLYKPMSNM